MKNKKNIHQSDPDILRIKGAREHNLKNINIDIPKGKIVVITGVSGSGKSSLAFDTIYAEGQRRYVESLSGGESQRIRLASQIGSGLTGVLYVLDEPSIGLHQKDNERLLETLIGLKDLGNTVIVVEHDEEAIRKADFIIDIGPGAGVHGGNISAFGDISKIINSKNSLTGKYLSKKLEIIIPETRRPIKKDKNITIYGDGSQTRSFCYVSDLIDVIYKFMDKEGNHSGPINIGNPGEFSIKDLAQNILSKVDTNSEIIFNDCACDKMFFLFFSVK